MALKKRKKKKKEWTLSRYLLPAARKIWFYSPLRTNVANSALVEVYKGIKTYRCQKCRKITEKVQVDHKLPVVDPEVGFVDWNTYFSRLFCDISNLWAICEKCHSLKTAREKKLRISKKVLDK